MTHYSEYANAESVHCIESATPCMYHRFHVVHICGCGKLYSHSQGDCDDHRLHPNGINIESEYYNHGDTAKSLFDRLQVYGLLPYFDENFKTVFFAIGEL